MTDEPTPITPLHFTTAQVLTVDAWHERTSFMPSFVERAYLHCAVYDEQAQTLTFDLFNGSATYKFSGETEPNGALIADLVEAKKTRRKV